MTTIKYNFSGMSDYGNPIWGAMVEIKSATAGLFPYVLLLVIFIVASYVFLRRTQDIAKSLISSNHIISVLTLILFYAGKTSGVEFISEVFLLVVLVVECFGLAGLYFMRMSKNEG